MWNNGRMKNELRWIAVTLVCWYLLIHTVPPMCWLWRNIAVITSTVYRLSWVQTLTSVVLILHGKINRRNSDPGHIYQTSHVRIKTAFSFAFYTTIVALWIAGLQTKSVRVSSDWQSDIFTWWLSTWITVPPPVTPDHKLSTFLQWRSVTRTLTWTNIGPSKWQLTRISSHSA